MSAAKILSCLGGLATAMLLLAPTDVHACSCFPVLEVGQARELPVNGALLVLESCGAQLSEITVTVDGAPVTLGGGDVRGAFHSAFSSTLEVGQRIEIDRRDPDFAPDIPAVSLMVVEADTTAPVLADFVLESSEPIEGDSCSDNSSALAVLSGTVDETSLDDGTRFDFVVLADGNLIEEVSVGRFYLQPENTRAGFSSVTGVPADEFCVQVTAVDAAGNRSETLEDCVEGTGAVESEDASGCSCTAEPASPSQRWAGLFAFGLLAAWGRRSRRRVADRSRRPG